VERIFQGNIKLWKLCQWVCRVCGTQHRLQGELSGSWNAHVFFCLLDTTSSKAALEQSSRAWLYFCRALAACRWISAFFLSELFNVCIVHGYIPNSCLNTTTVPISKNKNGNLADTSNYRPVAVATLVSKLLEHFMSSSISPFLGTTDNQFGFKAGHSTDQCTFLLKQTASYFVTHGSSVHAVFLDASKAFDRVLLMKLFEKLIHRKVPMCFVRLLKHWYKNKRCK